MKFAFSVFVILIWILFPCIGIGLLVYDSLALTGYSYSSTLSVTNSSGSNYYGRTLYEINGASLIDNGFIQSDAGDVRNLVDTVSEEIVTTNLTNSGTWVFDYVNIPNNTTVDMELWYGNPTATRNQAWIGAGSDSCVVSDIASLDIISDLQINVTITPLVNTGTIQQIVFKEDAYELYMDSTPEFVFHIYQSGTDSSVNIPATLGTEVNLVATFDPATTITDGILSHSIATTGTMSVNANDVQIAQIAGIIDDVVIYDTAIEMLNLRFEPTQITRTTIADQSGQINTATYALVPMPTDIVVSMAPMESTSDITFLTQDAGVPSALAVLEEPDNMFPDEVDMQGRDGIIYSLVRPFSEETGVTTISVVMLTWILYGACMVMMIYGLSLYMPHLWLIGICACFVTGIFIAMGPLPWWMIIMTVLGTLATTSMERSPVL